MTLRSVGPNGGSAAAFSYDLAKSVVYTRQGNPAWAGQERDGIGPIRSDDLFFGGKAGDPQPDWVDLNKVAIPQADEQQRLLTNLIGQMNLDRKPLPRFWFLPRDEKAAVVMTGDDHGNGGTAGRFEQTKERQSRRVLGRRLGMRPRRPPTSIPNTPITDAQAATTRPAKASRSGCTSRPNCENWSRPRTARKPLLDPAGSEWHGELPQPRRAGHQPHPLHHLERLGDASRRSSSQNGIRLDTNYYYWPGQLGPGQAGNVHRVRDADAIRRSQRLADRRLPGDDPDDR